MKDGRQAEAVMIPLGEFGQELQYRLNGDWYYTHVYKDGEGWKLLEDAAEKKKDLEAKGWTVPTD